MHESRRPLDAKRPPTGLTRSQQLRCALFVVVFVGYALNYAYFFVDDEAIPFVYAQNLLRGNGLVYNPDDGPVEGYSDFLNVWIDLAFLGLVTALGLSKLWALALAKLFAFCCAIGVLVVTLRLLQDRSRGDAAPVIAGMTFLTLAGPLGVWSWSGLETALFALIVAGLVARLFDADRSDVRNDRAILLSIVAAFLCRIDGFVWAGALVAPFLIALPRDRRRELMLRAVLPALALFAAYHAWRIAYFRELLPMPVYAKVLFKLRGGDVLITNEPAERYVIAFLRAYHWIPLAVLSFGFARGYYRSVQTRSLAIGIALVLAYIWIVGDWMFGFRFFVPLLAPMAILAAAGFTDLSGWRPRVAAAALAIWIAALGGVAYQFWRTYARQQDRESWLLAPSLDPERFFAPYYQIYEEARRYVRPGETVAYNQAGFVPFMLDARNVDDLGICTKFYAKLPTTDVVFTEVGRYSPLTGQPALRAADVYTLSRAPRLLLAPGGNIRAANAGFVPETVLGGAYRLRFSTTTVAGYEPVDGAVALRAPRYLENVAHISHLRRAWVNGRVLAASDYQAALRYLYGGKLRLTFEGRYEAEFTFGDHDVDVYELHIGGIRSGEAASATVTLLDGTRRAVYRHRIDLPPHVQRDLHETLAEVRQAATLSIVVVPTMPGVQALDIDDVRVQGQTPALRRFLRDPNAVD